MPSSRHIALTILVMTLSAAPSAAQWFSDRPAQCPVGTFLSRSGKCIKGSRRSKQSASPSLPRRAPKAHRSKAIIKRAVKPVKACSGFNGNFTAWYQMEVAEYESIAKRHRDNEASMKRHIDRQKILARDLKRKVFRARHTGVRRELSAQWNAVRRDVISNKSHLKSIKKKNRTDEAKWKKEFKGRLKQKLHGRPLGCKVKAAG